MQASMEHAHVHAGELVTRAQGDARDAVGRLADNGQLAVVDPECRLIGLHLYDGMLKVCGGFGWVGGGVLT